MGVSIAGRSVRNMAQALRWVTFTSLVTVACGDDTTSTGGGGSAGTAMGGGGEATLGGGGSGGDAGGAGATGGEATGGAANGGNGGTGGATGPGGGGADGGGGFGGDGGAGGQGGGPSCGDGVADPGEACDGLDLDGADCTDFGFDEPDGLGCSGTCMLDATGCTPTCDGGTLEPGEFCDGTDLDGHDCTEAGFVVAAGATCDACSDLDVTGCTPTCGNILEPGEECDGANLGNSDCTDFGFVNPAGLGCDNCQLDPSGCQAACGNARVEPGEDCDPPGPACLANCTILQPGNCVDGNAQRAIVPPTAGGLVITEFHANPAGTDTGKEWFELYVTNPASMDLNGLELGRANVVEETIRSIPCLTVAPGQRLVFAGNDGSMPDGGLPPPFYRYGFVLVNSNGSLFIGYGGNVHDAVSWVTAPSGASKTLKESQLTTVANDLATNFCTSTTFYGDMTDKGSPGAADPLCP